MKMRSTLQRVREISGVLFLGAILAACQDSGQAGGEFQPPNVVVDTVERKNITVEAELPGRTAASVIAEVRPQVGGIILSQNFTEGTHVEEGETLYQIDPSTYEANLMQAEAVLARAKANLTAAKARADRINSLRSSKAISRQDIDDANSALLQAEAEVLGAESQVKSAQINLDYTKMKAPISGQIGRSNFTQGALVQPGQPMEMAVIQVLDPMKVNIAYSSAEFSEVQRKIQAGIYTSTKVKNPETGEEEEGHYVRIYLDDGSLYDKSGYIKFSDLTVDQTTGSILLQAQFENDGRLLPGMFVKTVVEQGIELGAIAVSQKAVTQGLSGVSTVIVVDENNIANVRPVKISRAHGQEWVLESGLEEGERIIVKGQQMVQMMLQRSEGQGIPVNIVPDDGTMQ